MTISTAEYRELYLIHDQNGSSAIPKNIIGDLLGLPTLFFTSGVAKRYYQDLSESEIHELDSILTQVGHSKASIESIEYFEGWFAVIMEGPFETQTAAQEEGDILFDIVSDTEIPEDSLEDSEEDWWDEVRTVDPLDAEDFEDTAIPKENKKKNIS